MNRVTEIQAAPDSNRGAKQKGAKVIVLYLTMENPKILDHFVEQLRLTLTILDGDRKEYYFRQ